MKYLTSALIAYADFGTTEATLTTSGGVSIIFKGEAADITTLKTAYAASTALITIPAALDVRVQTVTFRNKHTT